MQFDEFLGAGVTKVTSNAKKSSHHAEGLMTKWLGAVLMAVCLFGMNPANAQQEKPEPRPGREFQGEPGKRVMGTVASVGVDRLTVKTMDGKEQTIMVNDQTRYREGEKDIQLEDLKPGDRVFVRSRAGADNQVAALVVRRVTDEQLQHFGGQGDRAFGEIVAIEKNQLKLRNRMQGERVVKIDEQTTFMKEGKPSTLADLKVGDRVMAIGKESGGAFTAAQVMSGPMGQGRWGGPRGGREGPPPTQ
jgi:3-dehydroquinate synthase class II